MWFLWLILGLKIPLIGLFYFIFRVMRAQDKAWEQGELDGGCGEDDGGGGGEPRVKPPAPPAARASGARPRARRPRSPRCAACRCAARRAAAPSRCARTTRGPLPERTGFVTAASLVLDGEQCAS